MTFSTNHRDLGDFSAFTRSFVMFGGLGRSIGLQKLTLRVRLTKFFAPLPACAAAGDTAVVTGQSADNPTFCASKTTVNLTVACPNAAPPVTRPIISTIQSLTNGLVFVLASFAVFAASNTAFNDFA